MNLLGQILCVIAAVTGVIAATMNIMGLMTSSGGMGEYDQFFYLFVNGVPFSLLIIAISLDRFQVFQERADSDLSIQLNSDTKEQIWNAEQGIRNAEQGIERLLTRLRVEGQ